MLSSITKLWELVLLQKLKTEVDDKCPLDKRQRGFVDQGSVLLNVHDLIASAKHHRSQNEMTKIRELVENMLIHYSINNHKPLKTKHAPGQPITTTTATSLLRRNNRHIYTTTQPPPQHIPTTHNCDTTQTSTILQAGSSQGYGSVCHFEGSSSVLQLPPPTQPQ